MAAVISGSDSAEELYCPSCDQSFQPGEPPLSFCPDDGTRLVLLASDPLIGVTLDGRFRIDKRLGAGGMGTVYRGTQTSIGREVAIKVIHSRLSQRTEVVKRFLREAKLASRLNQPTTVTVIDFGQSEDGLLYLIMELLSGQTLAELIEAEAPLPLGRAAAIAVQLCDALEQAHAISIVHRDLKPSNVVVLDGPRDVIKVLDFGLAKSLADDSATTITQSDAILGTPAYISPEAVLGRETDARSDLYSLGVILYEMIAGRLPFSAATANLMLTAHVSDPPRPLPPEIDARARALIGQLLAKAPGDRPASAAEVRAGLEPLRSITTRAAPPPTFETLGGAETVAPGALETPAKGRKVAAFAVAAVIAIAGVIVALSFAGGGGHSAPAPVTDAAAEIAPAALAIDGAPIADAPLVIDAGAAAFDAAPKRAVTRRRRHRRRPNTEESDAKKPESPPPAVYFPAGGGGDSVP